MPVNKVTCECGCSITYTNLARHRKTSKHYHAMDQCNVCEVPPPIEEIQPTSEQRVTVIKTLKKSPIDPLPQVLQNMIYEFASDTKPKDNFIRVFPEIMRLAMKYEGGFRNALSAKIKFYTDGYMIRYDEDNTSRVTEFSNTDDLREYIRKHSSKRWLHLSKYTNTETITAITSDYYNPLYDSVQLTFDTKKTHKLILYGCSNTMYDYDLI